MIKPRQFLKQCKVRTVFMFSKAGRNIGLEVKQVLFVIGYEKSVAKRQLIPQLGIEIFMRCNVGVSGNSCNDYFRRRSFAVSTIRADQAGLLCVVIDGCECLAVAFRTDYSHTCLKEAEPKFPVLKSIFDDGGFEMFN